MGPDGRNHTLRTVALVALVLLTFGRVASHEFVNIDDDKFIAANPNFLPPTFAGLAECWRQPHARLYVPMTMSAWWLVAYVVIVTGALQLLRFVWVYVSLRLSRLAFHHDANASTRSRATDFETRSGSTKASNHCTSGSGPR